MQSAYNQMLALSCLISERRWLRISRLTQHVKQCHGDGIECEMINYEMEKEILAFTVNVPPQYWNLWLRIRDAVLKSDKFPLFSGECGCGLKCDCLSLRFLAFFTHVNATRWHKKVQAWREHLQRHS